MRSYCVLFIQPYKFQFVIFFFFFLQIYMFKLEALKITFHSPKGKFFLYFRKCSVKSTAVGIILQRNAPSFFRQQSTLQEILSRFLLIFIFKKCYYFLILFVLLSKKKRKLHLQLCQTVIMQNECYQTTLLQHFQSCSNIRISS